jgi:hypothetical protein
MFVHMSLIDEELEDAAQHNGGDGDEQEVGLSYLTVWTGLLPDPLYLSPCDQFFCRASRLKSSRLAQEAPLAFSLK